jgi:hypothetical protein
MVGNAIDYLLRFELQRRAPHAVSRRWVAELTPDMLCIEGDGIWSFLPLLRDERGIFSISSGPNPHPRRSDGWTGELNKQLSRRARRVVENAKVAVAANVRNASPSRAEVAELAAHAIRLAMLDDLPRANRLHPAFDEAASEDVQDLLAMLAIVPFPSLLHEESLLLNPTFGESSRLVGGADADLITGHMLVDFKATKEPEMTATALDQLLAYLILARHHRRTDPTFPEIGRLALYFCRYGHLWALDVATWTERAEFPSLERWFLKRAKETARVPGIGKERHGLQRREADRQR